MRGQGTHLLRQSERLRARVLQVHVGLRHARLQRHHGGLARGRLGLQRAHRGCQGRAERRIGRRRHRSHQRCGAVQHRLALRTRLSQLLLAGIVRHRHITLLVRPWGE
jgi:hypothetical protein